jgi:psiF repeat
MRFTTVAAAVCLSLLPAAPPQLRAHVPVPSSSVPDAAKPAPASAAAPSSDAAVRHAKRTACLKDAKARKLVGAEKTAFLKSCIATP